MDGGGRVAVLPAGQLVGAGVGEGGEPGSDRQAAGGGVDQLVGDAVERGGVLSQDGGGGGSGPGGDLLDDGHGVAPQLAPGPGAALAPDLVGPGRGGDDAEGLPGLQVLGAAGQGGRVAGDLAVELVVDDAVGGARAVGLAEGVAVAHGESMHAYGSRGKSGPAENLGEPWERSVTPATLPLYSYGLLPPTGGVSLLLNL
uniref:Uncharacterized protein n=1 Tax=Phage sp. ct4bw6 TaxID=2826747 RepID=A0A8S5MV22_9VIRU|nr:MAG TPA: hypothetical protein [Phage sp. ct4bw6]